MVFDLVAITNGENAINVLGQSSFTTATSATTQNGMKNPQGVSIDPQTHTLYVSDTNNHHVTVYDVTAITNGENATGVLGQANYTSGSAATAQNRMNTPNGALILPPPVYMVRTSPGVRILAAPFFHAPRSRASASTPTPTWTLTPPRTPTRSPSGPYRSLTPSRTPTITASPHFAASPTPAPPSVLQPAKSSGGGPVPLSIGTSGPSVAIATDPATNDEQSAIAYNQDSQEYLAVWRTWNGQFDIQARRVTAGGQPTGSAIPVFVGGGDQQDPSVAYGAGVYLVAWTDGSFIVGQLIAPDGALLGTWFNISAGSDANVSPSVDYNPVSGEFLVA